MGKDSTTERGPQRIGRVLDRLLGTMRAPSVDVLDSVFSRWPEIVGPDVAAHCRPVSIESDTLTVAAEDSTWASELRWLEKDLLTRLAEVAGTDCISAVKVRVGRRK
ncbi:MAG: DUF721 domain-containing protein [Acidimicrobiales bacterium]|nr:DUF721 domain-containing protein [Acidimicrobiales bacterium]